jgi:hypothetical protein
MRPSVRTLAARRHTVFRLAPGLLLVFKPRAHAEPVHAHPRPQRLVVLRGRLAVETASGRIALVPRTPPLVLPARTPHATRALADTWLVAEALPRGYVAAAARSGSSRKRRRRRASARAASRAR